MINVTDLVIAILLISEDIRANGNVYIATDGYHYSSRGIYKAMCQAIGKNDLTSATSTCVDRQLQR